MDEDKILNEICSLYETSIPSEKINVIKNDLFNIKARRDAYEKCLKSNDEIKQKKFFNLYCISNALIRFDLNHCFCVGCHYSGNVFNESGEIKYSFINLHKQYPYCEKCWVPKRISLNEKRMRKHRKNKFGISQNQYSKLKKSQFNKCAICGCYESHVHHVTGEKLALAVDHCHKTGKVRSLLCRNCNLLIGNSREKIEILKKAIKYLEEHKEELK